MTDLIQRLMDKQKFSTLNRLKKDIERLNNNKLSTTEFRQRWNRHFACKTHVAVCDCHGHFCPFTMLATKTDKVKDNG